MLAMPAMPSTVYRFQMRGMPSRSFKIDSTNMLTRITCDDGRKFNTPCWWLGSSNYLPLTPEETRLLDLNHMGNPVHDDDHFRVVIRYNNEDECIYFKKVVNTPSA